MEVIYFAHNLSSPDLAGGSAEWRRGDMHASIRWFTPGERIMPLRVLDPEGVGNVWVLAEHCNTPCSTAPQVVNLAVVEAAGNFASQTAVFPAGFSLRGAVVVAASEPSDALAAFSDSGSWVTVEAPGDGIVSTVPGGGTGFGQVQQWRVHWLANRLCTTDFQTKV